MVTKIQSTESRKQRWAKLLFGLYQALGDIETSLSLICSTLENKAVFVDVGAQIAHNIEDFSRSIRKMSSLMGEGTFELFQIQNQPDKLQALGIFDENIAQVLIRAWFMDGGFVEAFKRIGLSYLFDQKVIRMKDAPFDPNSRVHGYAVKLNETDFRLDKDKDVQKLISIVVDTREAVGKARNDLKAFLSKSFKLEDVM